MAADDGKVRVERSDDAGGLRLSIAALSGLYSGYLGPSELAAVGAMDAGHPSASFLEALFAGPPPFMLDHF